jgi:hypothetical protein
MKNFEDIFEIKKLIVINHNNFFKNDIIICIIKK